MKIDNKASFPDRFHMLGLSFNSYDMKETISRIESFIESKGSAVMLTPSAELIVRAIEDSNLKNFYNNCDILTPDSYVVFYTAKLLGKSVKEPVSASRVMFNLFELASKKGYRLYLLGAKADVLEKCVQIVSQKYPEIIIAGSHNGYFDLEKDYDIISEIKACKPDILFLAMTSPMKEHFLQRNVSKMSVPISIGVGGAFDIIAGKCKLAPLWISKIGLEWLYRFIQEPRRMWKRYLFTNIKYILLVFKELITGSSNVQK